MQVAVAAQQFQAKACTDVEFGLYCATQPTVAASTGLRFSCWMGAYPGLAAHFRAAGLNPGNNHWDKVRPNLARAGAVQTSPALAMFTRKHRRRAAWLFARGEKPPGQGLPSVKPLVAVVATEPC